MSQDAVTTVSLRLRVRGNPDRFGGRHSVSGFKHSLVLAAGACAVAEGSLHISNVPRIAETQILTAIMRAYGAQVTYTHGALDVDASSLQPATTTRALERQIHGSVYLLPGILRKTGTATLAAGGGCALGSGPAGIRPFDHFAQVVREFGVEIDADQDGTIAAGGRSWRGAYLDMSRYLGTGSSAQENHYSGATKMAVLMAAAAESPSVIRNPYAKYEMNTLLEVLHRAGVNARYKQDGRDLVLVVDPRGGARFDRNAEVRLPPDLIEIVTLISAAATFGTDDLLLANLRGFHMADGLREELAAFRRFGVKLELGPRWLRVKPMLLQLTGTEVTSCHAPSPYSDSQPFFALLGAFARGTSFIRDEVWPLRFNYASELRKLGFSITSMPSGIAVHGGARGPKALAVHASDLRSAAVLTLAAAGLSGETVVGGAEHLDRGYPDLVGALTSLGADIEREGT